MFTLNLRNIVRIGRETMKWSSTGPASSPDVAKKSLQSQIIDIGKSAKDGIDFLTKRQGLLEKATEDELKKLKELAIAKKAGKTPEYNEKLRQDIQIILDSRSAEKTKATTTTSEILKINKPELKPAIEASEAKLKK